MKILLSWSSGKDSAWALHLLRRSHPDEVASLLTTVNADVSRVAMHGVRQNVLEAQARAVGLPLRVVHIPNPCSNEIYERRMGAAVADALAAGFTHLAFGDLFLPDIRSYRERQLAGSGLEPLFPLWDLPTSALAEQMIDGGLRARLACVDTRAISPAFAGREFDRRLLRDLPPGIDPCGENGEFHTCVYDGPMFSHRVDIRVGRTEVRDPFIWADLVTTNSEMGSEVI
jgi:uncharacterized protein (TIGR00290 family)